MRRTVLGAVAVALGAALGCGGSAPQEVSLGTVDPSLDDAVAARATDAAAAADIGPGTVPEPVVEALTRVHDRARLVRCRADAPDGGVVSGVWLGPKEEPLRAVTWAEGWLTAVVPTVQGRAVVTVDDRAATLLRWTEAHAGAWAECVLEPVARYQILGLVARPDGTEIAGATVRGCEPGAVTRTNEAGRFELQGVAHRDCPLVAIVEDGGGFGKSETNVIRSDGADVIADDVVVPPERVRAAAIPDQARDMHALLERQVRNVVEADAEAFERRVAEAALSPAARAVAERWVADARRRVQARQAVVAALGRGDREGLLEFWLRDY